MNIYCTILQPLEKDLGKYGDEDLEKCGRCLQLWRQENPYDPRAEHFSPWEGGNWVRTIIFYAQGPEESPWTELKRK